MARLATVPAFERRLEMRRKFKVFLVNIFVAGLTNIRADVLGRVLLRRRPFLIRITSKSRLEREPKHWQEKNGRCG